MARPAGEYGTYRPRPFKPRANKVVGSLDAPLGELAEKIMHLVNDRHHRHRSIRAGRRTAQDGRTLLFTHGRMLCECAMNEAYAWRVERDPRLQIIGVYDEQIDLSYLLADLLDVRTI